MKTLSMKRELDHLSKAEPVHDGFLSDGPATQGRTLIAPDRVAVWWLQLDRINADEDGHLEQLLSAEESERAARFRFARDRRVYVAAHAICRGLLSYCCGGDPLGWRFSIGDHGKPEVMTASGSPRLRVNLSHTRGFSAVALTQDHDIGIDVERLQRDAPTEKLAERVLAKCERQRLQAAPVTEQVAVFLRFWTLKEAYVKAVGRGLSQPLDAFSFDLETLRIVFAEGAAEDPAHWHFEQSRIGSEHLMALAVHHPTTESLERDIRQAPLDYLSRLATG